MTEPRPDGVAPRPTREPLGRHVTQRLFGPAAPYILYLRPGEWPVLALHAAMGWWLATGFTWPNSRAWLGIVAWVVGLNGGSLALNSALADQRRELLFLEDAPAVPRGLTVVAVCVMLAGLAVAWQLPGGYRELYLLSLLLSLAASVPPIRLEAIGGADWIIVMLCFGVFTPAAAWAITGASFSGPRALAIWSFAPLLGGIYPLTQLHRLDIDRERGIGTFASWLGQPRTLMLALIGTGFGFGMLTMAAWLSDWHGGVDLLRWGALLTAAVAWLAVLGPWYIAGRGWSAHDHRRALHQALVAWVLTDIAVIVAWGL